MNNFFKVLNNKIKHYDKTYSNPFKSEHPLVLIWIEDVENNSFENDYGKNV